jgi:antibiotic biosynthesis monooxygenase (ABM) superfamily enzyme
MNMIVLLLLYPIVFLFGFYVQTPYLSKALGLPFSVALFCANTVSTVLLAFFVPMLANRNGWWLTPTGPHARRIEILGAALIVLLYAAMIAVFTTFF